MTDHQINDPLKELEAALAIEPSPAFAPGVRARVAESTRRGTWPVWQEMAAAAVIAVAVLGGFWWRTGQVRVQPAPEPSSVPLAIATPLATPLAAAPAATSSGKPVVASRAVVRAETPAALEVIVPPDQAMALNRLLAGLKAHTKPDQPTTDLPPVVIQRLPLITPVRIEPIVIDPLVPISPSSGGKEKER